MKTQRQIMRISSPHTRKLTEIVVPLKYFASFKENIKVLGWKITELKVVGIWNFQEKIATRWW